VGSSEQDNELLGAKEVGEFLDQLSEYTFLRAVAYGMSCHLYCVHNLPSHLTLPLSSRNIAPQFLSSHGM
jgi:hypothetical protein